MEVRDLTPHLWTFFTKRNGKYPVVYEGRNYTKETLTYMTPANRADKIADIIAKALPSPSVQLLLFEPCGGMGGNTVAFLSHTNFSCVLTYEQEADRALMLKRNVMAYDLGDRSFVFDKTYAVNIRAMTQFKGCGFYFDPPFLKPTIPGHSKSKEEIKELYLGPGEITVSGRTPQQYMTEFADFVYIMVWQMPPNWHEADISVPGWKIQEHPIYKGKGKEVISTVVFVCINENTSVRTACMNNGGTSPAILEIVKNCRGGAKMTGSTVPVICAFTDTPVPDDLVPGNVQPPSKPETSVAPPKEIVPVKEESGAFFGSLARTRSAAPARKPETAAPSSKPVPPARKPETVAPSSKPVPKKVSTATDAAIDTLVKLTKYTKDLPEKATVDFDSPDWIVQLCSYIREVLILFIEKEEIITKLFDTEEKVAIWIKAFTHETFDLNSDKNYEILELMGDSISNYTLKRYLVERFPRFKERELSEYKSRYLSKTALAQLSKEFKFCGWCRTRGFDALIDINVHEDLIESFYGALSTIGDMVRLGFGIVLCYSLTHFIYENAEFKSSIIEGTYKTIIWQKFCQGFGLSQPEGIKNVTSDGHYTGAIKFDADIVKFYESLEITIPSITQEYVGQSQKSALETAWRNAYELFTSQGVTDDWIAQKRESLFVNKLRDNDEKSASKYTSLKSALKAKNQTLEFYKANKAGKFIVQMYSLDAEGVYTRLSEAADADEIRATILALNEYNPRRV